MEDDKETCRWIGDQLINLLGYNNPMTILFVIELAKKTKTLGDLISQLEIFNFPTSQDTKTFAWELQRRFPYKNTSFNIYQKAEKEAIVLIRKLQQYQCLDSDADEDEDVLKAMVEKRQKNDKRGEEEKHKRHIQRKHEENVDENEEVISIKRGRNTRIELESHEDEEMERKRVREQDQQEKEELEERLFQKDVAFIKKLGDFKLLKKQKEGERRSEAQKQKKFNLKQVSREEYLKKRETKKLQELEDELIDEEFLFDGMKLTTKEQAKYRYKKEMFELAKQCAKHVDKNFVGYHMPEAYDKVDGVRQDKRFSVALKCYMDVECKEQVSNLVQQEAWEKIQINKAILKFGAGNKRKISNAYECVFEDQIDFIQATIMVRDWINEDAEAKKKARILVAKSEREKLLEDRKNLPIYRYREELLDAIKKHQILVIEGETGSGKTTQIPQYLHEAGYCKQGKIGCTQPRRVAAMSVATRVAVEMGVKLGNEVGFSVRFENCTSDKTMIKYMTDGMLLQEFLGEPDFATYSVMIVDEAHERTMNTDILFGLFKDIIRYQPNIKLLISSATLDSEKFCDFFDGAPLFRIPGRQFLVDILYTKAPEADYLEATIKTVLQIHMTELSGDVLVFLSGQEEIEIVEEILKHQIHGYGSKIGKMIIHKIYANLPSNIQAKIFEETPLGARKVVLATNIAETSLTIDGIKYVIDPGFCKNKSYSPRTNMESLIVTPISQAAAQQRAGRAGRTSVGKCFRLYTTWSFQNEMNENTIPEIQRTNLANVVLLLKNLGINDLINFDFIDPPPIETLFKALEQLYALGALNDCGELTKTGRRMAQFPMDPMLSKMLIASDNYKCSKEILTICAMLSIGNSIFYCPKDKKVHANAAHMQFHIGNVGDHIALLKVYNSWKEMNFSSQWCYENYIQEQNMKRARDIRNQLEGLLKRVEIDSSSNLNELDNIKKAITSGFFFHTAKLQNDGFYRTIKNPQIVSIHPSSGLSHMSQLSQQSYLKEARWVIYHQLVKTKKEYMRQVIEIKPDWLVEIAPHYYNFKDVESFETRKMPKVNGRTSKG